MDISDTLSQMGTAHCPLFTDGKDANYVFDSQFDDVSPYFHQVVISTHRSAWVHCIVRRIRLGALHSASNPPGCIAQCVESAWVHCTVRRNEFGNGAAFHRAL